MTRHTDWLTWLLRGTICLLVFGSVRVAYARIEPSHLVAPGMVLQQQARVHLWGRARPGVTLRARLDDRPEVDCRVDDRGRWSVHLPTPAADRQTHRLVFEAGDDRLVLDDVLIGEVWLCAGQSNMAMPVARAERAEAMTRDLDTLQLRLFCRSQASTMDAYRGVWSNPDPDTVSRFSAVGWWTGRQLHDALDVPVGLIQATYGGSRIETWVPPDCFDTHPSFEGARRRWQRVRALATAEHRQGITGRYSRLARPESLARPGALYEFYIRSISCMTVRGVLWYQGESDVEEPRAYQGRFRAMIETWRRAWARHGQQYLPMVFVQIAGAGPSRSTMGRYDAVALLRESQYRVWQAVPHTTMVTAVDLGYPDTLHPPGKIELAERLASAVRANIYGHQVDWCGPVFRSMQQDGATLRLSFNHADEDLRLTDAAVPDFFVAGLDRVFHPARAHIEGDVVVLQSDAVEQPVAARYAWQANPACVLRDTGGLPALPFRTDDWPIPDKEQIILAWAAPTAALGLVASVMVLAGVAILRLHGPGTWWRAGLLWLAGVACLWTCVRLLVRTLETGATGLTLLAVAVLGLAMVRPRDLGRATSALVGGVGLGLGLVVLWRPRFMLFEPGWFAAGLYTVPLVAGGLVTLVLAGVSTTLGLVRARRGSA